MWSRWITGAALGLTLGSAALEARAQMRAPAVVDSIAPAAAQPRDPIHPDGAFALGDKGYIDFGDPGDAFDLAPDGGRTYAMWLYYDTPVYHVKLLDKRTKSLDSDVHVGFTMFLQQFTASPGIFLDRRAITVSGLRVAGTAGLRTVDDGRWHHVAYTQEGDVLSIYVDGTLDVTYDAPLDMTRIATHHPLWFGWNGRASVHYTGLVDDMSIWGRALTPEEIRHVMYTPPTSDAPGLTAYYPLDAVGPGGRVEDAGPNGYHGRAYDLAVVPAGKPLRRPWTESPWVYVLAALAGIGVLYGLMRAYAWRIERQRQRLQRVVEEQTAELSDALETVESQTEQLQRLDRAKSLFFQNVSHEFRTPLTLMLGPLDDLRAGLYGDLDAPVGEQLGLVHRNGRRLLGLVTQILDIARLEAGQAPLRARRLDLGAFVARRAEPFRGQAARKALALEVRTPEDRGEAPVTVWADPVHLDKVVGNLLGNAFKYTPGGGAIRIDVDRDAEAGTAYVAVRDSGAGIPAAELPFVFDRFRRAGEGAAQPVGTGIGLALAKELTDLHGGTLTAESEEGFGSTFTLTLKLGRDHLAPEQMADDADGGAADGGMMNGRAEALAEAGFSDAALGDETDRAVPEAADADDEDQDEDVTTVLVVEDHDEVRAYVRRHLERPHNGDPAYRVIEAADGEAGLALARERLPDLVLSDVMMPGLDGLGLCRALKADAATSFIPVVLLTAKAAPEDRMEGLEGEADDYLTKPFDPAELRARVANLIRQRQRLRERFRQEGIALVLGEDEATPDAATPDAHAAALLQPPLPADVSDGTAVPENAAFAEAVRAAVEGHLGDEDFGVEALAEAVALSRSQLHRRLREVVGETPSGVIRGMRLARAAQLLAAEAGSVAEVAYAVGYRSVSHFSAAFRKVYGCPPSAYPADGGSDSDSEKSA